MEYEVVFTIYGSKIVEAESEEAARAFFFSSVTLEDCGTFEIDWIDELEPEELA